MLGYNHNDAGTYSLSESGIVSAAFETIGMSGTGTFTQTGGSNSVSNTLWIGYNTSFNGTYNLSGSGVLSAATEYLGYAGLSTGIVNQFGGANTVGSLYLGWSSQGNGTYNLSGGTLFLSSLVRGPGAAIFNFGGGRLSANATFSTSLPITLTGIGGDATVDTASHTLTLSGVLSGPGGLKKLNSGTLTLSAANTYKGDTDVEGGTLSIAIPYLDDLAGIHISSDAVLNLDFTGSDTVGSLYLDGLLADSGTWGSSLSSAAHIDNAHFSGSGMLNVVPEPSTLALLGMGATGLLAFTLRRKQASRLSTLTKISFGLFATLCFCCTAATVHAAIVGSGDVSPLDPNTWTSSTTGYIGQNSTGAVAVDGGSGLLSNTGYLGYNSGATGTATVTGTGSIWTNSGSLYVGNYGSGTLKIEAGGQVSNTDGYLGDYSGSIGTASVTGSGSAWTNSGNLSVGLAGDGTLTVADGGAVTAGTLFASLSNLFGNGTITAKGAVLDTDLVFDSTHGIQQTIAFGTGGSLNLNLDGSGDLGVSSGTIRIADGLTVPSSWGRIGFQNGFTATATVTGQKSAWSSSGNFDVGESGNGQLTIEAGGRVSSANGYVATYPGSTGMPGLPARVQLGPAAAISRLAPSETGH